MVWRVALPTATHPIIVGDRIFLTGLEQDKLFTFCLRKSDGKILWKRESPGLARNVRQAE